MLPSNSPETTSTISTRDIWRSSKASETDLVATSTIATWLSSMSSLRTFDSYSIPVALTDYPFSAFRKEDDEVNLDDDWDVELVGARFFEADEDEAEDEVATGSVGDGADEVDGGRV